MIKKELINNALERINSLLSDIDYEVQFDGKTRVILFDRFNKQEVNHFYASTTKFKYDSLCRFLNILRVLKDDFANIAGIKYTVSRLFDISGSENY